MRIQKPKNILTLSRRIAFFIKLRNCTISFASMCCNKSEEPKSIRIKCIHCNIVYEKFATLHALSFVVKNTIENLEIWLCWSFLSILRVCECMCVWVRVCVVKMGWFFNVWKLPLMAVIFVFFIGKHSLEMNLCACNCWRCCTHKHTRTHAKCSICHRF